MGVEWIGHGSRLKNYLQRMCNPCGRKRPLSTRLATVVFTESEHLKHLLERRPGEGVSMVASNDLVERFQVQ